MILTSTDLTKHSGYSPDFDEDLRRERIRKHEAWLNLLGLGFKTLQRMLDHERPLPTYDIEYEQVVKACKIHNIKSKLEVKP